MKKILEIIDQAIASGELVNIVYNGGSAPGSLRTIIALSVSSDHLTARDPASGIVKLFKLEKIVSACLSDGVFVKIENASLAPSSQVPIYKTLAEYAAEFSPILKEKSWNIILKENYFAIGAYFKNGKPKKKPSVSIQYFDPTLETVYDLESNDFVTRKRELTGRERPWRVDSWRQPQGYSYSKLHKAIEVFLQEANESSPFTAGTIR